MDLTQIPLANSTNRTSERYKRSRSIQPLNTLTILIPCYNEAQTIAQILEKVLDAQLICNISKEIILVNDHSTDDTDLLVREFMEENPNSGIRYITHEINKGKGASIQTGINAATGDYLIIQDADLEYDPLEYNLLIGPILSGNADVVYGSRFMGGNPHRVLFFWHTWGNKLLTLINNLLTNMNLTDAHTCYKVLPLKLIRQLDLKEKRFAFDSELNVKLAYLKRLRIYEVGISYYGRTFSDGKKIRFRDALRSVFCLIKYSRFKTKGTPKINKILAET